MIQPRRASLLTHLTLAASGLCLAVASMPLLPEMPFLVIGYLLLIGGSWRWGSQWVMPTWAANVLALVIAGGAVGYVMLRVHSSVAFEWIRDLPVQVALLPLLGPVLLPLSIVRLLRSRDSRDILQLHGIALLQVALGCVLASPTLFGVFLLVYFVLALGALAANEARARYREARPPDDLVAPPGSLRREIRFGLRWLLVVVLPAYSLFLMLPRLDGRQWEPLARLGSRRPRAAVARTGSSDEIDLRRTGTLVNDDTVAFVVKATSPTTGVPDRMPPDQHWRGHVLDRYERGVWKGELSGFNGVPQVTPPRAEAALAPSSVLLEFRVQGQTGSLFLAEPIIPGAVPGQLPLFTEAHPHGMPLFFEGGGTALPMTYLPRTEYRYTQQFFPRQSRSRYPCVRVGDLYQLRLLRCDAVGMLEFTLKLLPRICDDDALRKLLREFQADLAKPEHQRRPVTLPPGQWSHICRLLADHLARSDEFTYDMTSRITDPTIDPTLDFLRNVRQGSCERYASSLTLMLRSVGIPARIVKGFRGWEPEGADHFGVLQRHAHAWVEAMVAADTTGPLEMEWLILDPTPAHEEATTSALVSWLQQQQRSGQNLWQDLILNYGPNSRSALLRELFATRWSRAVSWLVFAAVLFIAFWWIRRHRARPVRPASLGPELLLVRLRSVLLARLKLATHPGQTPAELAELARLPLAERPLTRPLADLPARVVALYYRERFGRVDAGSAEVAALAAEIDRLTMALGN